MSQGIIPSNHFTVANTTTLESGAYTGAATVWGEVHSKGLIQHFWIGHVNDHNAGNSWNEINSEAQPLKVALSRDDKGTTVHQDFFIEFLEELDWDALPADKSKTDYTAVFVDNRTGRLSRAKIEQESVLEHHVDGDGVGIIKGVPPDEPDDKNGKVVFTDEAIYVWHSGETRWLSVALS